MVSIDRRRFMTGGVAAAACALAGRRGAEAATGDRPEAAGGSGILFGACRKIGDVAALKAAGYDFWEWSVPEAFNPEKDGEWWKKQRDRLAAAPLPLRSCNGFIPGKFRITGPAADHEPALKWAEVAMRRAEEAGVKTIVFGSGGARNVPGDFTGKNRPDVEKGVEQYTRFCIELARRTADLANTTVVIEPLRPNESNIINYVWQGAQIVEAAGSPRIRLLADIFHMMMGRESAESITRAADLIKHCHIADWSTRRYPGENPNETRRLAPYLLALKKAGYAGGVSCECGWPGKEPFAAKLEKALATMKGIVK